MNKIPRILILTLFLLLILSNTGYSQVIIKNNIYHFKYLMNLVKANNINELEKMINLGMNINIIGKREETLLHWASAFSNKKTVQFLIDNNFQVNSQDKLGKTPLFWASYSNNLQNLDLLLLNGADYNIKDILNKQVIDYMKARNNWQVIDIINEFIAYKKEKNNLNLKVFSNSLEYNKN